MVVVANHGFAHLFLPPEGKRKWNTLCDDGYMETRSRCALSWGPRPASTSQESVSLDSTAYLRTEPMTYQNPIFDPLSPGPNLPHRYLSHRYEG